MSINVNQVITNMAFASKKFHHKYLDTCQVNMNFFILLFFLRATHAIKIFTFESWDGSGGNLSYAALENPTSLPPVFTLCSSFKESFIAGKSFFTLYGQDNKPWVTLSNWVTGNKITIWLRVTTIWTKIGVIETYWINFWIHVCIHINTKSGDISLSLNGEQPFVSNIPELGEQRPNNLQNKLFLGISDNGEDGQEQFKGKVANIKIFSDNEKAYEDIQLISSNLCAQEGDVLNYHTKWEIFGHVEETEEESWKICNRNKTYRVAIPAKMNWNEAIKVCRKLGAGNLTETKTVEDVNYTISLFKKMKSSCTDIWTPLTDVDKEGEYRNTITRQVSLFLPWEVNQPDGADEANYIALRLLSSGYHDTYHNHPHCASCDLHKHTQFALLGVCQDSYFGKKEIVNLEQCNFGNNLRFG